MIKSAILLAFTAIAFALSVSPGFAAEGDGGPQASGPDTAEVQPADETPAADAAPEEKMDPVIKEIIDEFGLWEDDTAKEFVKGIGDKLTAVVDDREKAETIKFRLLDDDLVNAFALADGNIFLFRGLVERAETADQLASVMAHEMTHYLHGHHNKGMDTVSLIQIVSILSAIAAQEQEPAIAGQMISAALIESYGRDAEIDADLNGMSMMIKAGFDPVGMLEFFGYMEGLERRRPQLGGNYFTVHPHANERISMLKEYLEGRGYDVPDVIYRLHLALDLESKEVDGHYECDVFVGDEIVFILAGDDGDKLTERGYEVIHRLRDAFAKGIRAYEVQARDGAAGHYIEAKRSVLVSVTNSDEKYLDGDATAINGERLENIKFILWQYYIERRI